MRDYRVGTFHKMIIASLCCLFLVGCGYKADPTWTEEASSTKQESK